LENAGDMKLVKQLKIFEWYTQPVNAEKTKHIEIEGDPFLLYKENLLSSTKKCEDLKDAFADNQQLIQFIKTNNLKCNQQNDLWRIVRFQKRV
jgi:hypothetical protein